VKPLPEFAWSKTRQDVFEGCEQAFVLRYLSAAGAEDPQAPEWKRELGVLKRLVTRHQWAGRVVHSAIAGVLLAARAGRGVDPEAVLGRMHRVMREDFAASRVRSYWHRPLRADFDGLVEHEYGDLVSPEAWRSTWASAHRAVSWFLGSRWPALAREVPAEAWREIDATDLRKSVFELDGSKTWAVPDAVFQQRDQVQVVAWKGGALRRGDLAQLQLQALGVHLRDGVPLAQLRATVVSLAEGREVEVPLDAQSLKQVRVAVKASAQRMRRHWVARPKAPKTTSLATCIGCPFRRPCGREVAVLQSTGEGSMKASWSSNSPSSPR
jgi:PD-(D/E)XK nuclease superfamily